MKKRFLSLLKKVNYKNLLAFFTILIIVIFLIFYGIHINLFQQIIDSKKTTDNLGWFGDFVGGFLGTIVATISTILLFYTFLLQRKQITDNALFLKRQQFESSFFALLSNLNDYVNSTSLRLHDKDYTGRKYFINCQAELVNGYRTRTDANSSFNDTLAAYEKLYLKHRHRLGTYFRILYRMYNFIDNAEIEANLKFHYAKILRATLSESELLLLNYNCRTVKGQNFRPLMIKYNILKHLPISSLLEFKLYWEHRTQSEYIDFVNLTDAIADKIRIAINDKKQIKFTFKKLKLGVYYIKNGIRIDIAYPSMQKAQKGFFEKLEDQIKDDYLRQLLWEVCVSSSFGSLLHSIEDLNFMKEFLVFDGEKTHRAELTLPKGIGFQIIDDHM